MSNCLGNSGIYACIPAQVYSQTHRNAKLAPHSAKFNLILLKVSFNTSQQTRCLKHKGQPLKAV